MPHRITLGLILGCCAVTFFTASCDKKTESETPMVATPAGLEAIVPAGAALARITDYTFDTSGSPVWMDGTLFFTNNNLDDAPKSRILKKAPDGTETVLREDNGVVTSLQLSGTGTIYACEMFGHRVVELDTAGQVIRVVAGEYNGIRLDGPNDMVVDAKGGIYFTESQFIGTMEKMQDTPAVYYVKPTGEIIRVIDDVTFPNGVALSPDGTMLYVANTPDKFLLAYPVNADGTVGAGSQFAELELSQANIDAGATTSGADGIRCDSAGNVWVATTQGLGIQIIAPDGTHLGNIPCDTATNNVNFGGADLKTVYISAKDGIYSMPTLVAGLAQPMQ